MRKFWFLILIVIFFSCNHSASIDIGKEAETVRNTDIAFSDLSAKKGMKTAFLQYIDSTAALLRPNHYPIVGKDAVDYLSKIDDSLFSLTWEPRKVDVAASGDLGYTYGIYTYHDKDTTYQGTYTSIWEKQADRSWKFVLDTGNPGVGTKK